MVSTNSESLRLSSNVCRCCNSFGFYTDILSEFDATDGREIYTVAIMKMFNIQLTFNIGETQLSRQICGECARKVRDAFVFRSMVVANESKMVEQLQHMIANEDENHVDFREFEHTFIKSENLKEEYKEDTYNDGSVVIIDDIRIKEESLGEETEDADELDDVTTTSRNNKDDSGQNKDKDWSHILETRGPAPILRENSLKLLRNSTMFPFQWKKSTYYCFVCKESFFDIATLKDHCDEHSLESLEKLIIRQNNRLIKVEIFSLNCRKCGRDLDSIEDLKRHLTDDHSVQFPIENSLLVPFKIGSEGLKCQLCSERFDGFRMLNIHINKHYKNHICHICGASFANLAFLYLHKTRTHKIHRCSLCNAHFDSQTAKRNHDIREHDKKIERKLRFVCSYCPQRFAQENLKIQHLVDKHGLKKPKFTCPLCSKEFITRSLCNNHVKHVHKKERKHECDVCQKLFYTKSDVSRHKVTHTGVKDYSCDSCSALLSTKNSLRRHIKRAHN